MEANTSLHDYIAIVRRRKWHMAVPAAAMFALAALLAFLLPPTYRSTATVLIEEPDIPSEMVRSTVTTYADQRLQTINQRVTATQNLTDIIARYDLYADQLRRQPMSEVVKKMREDIGLKVVSAGQDRNSRQPASAIAFSLSFDHRDQRMAQLVANELVSRFLEENLRSRREQTAETTAFLSRELERLETVIEGYEKRMAELKARHAGSLPEDLAFNMQMIESTERDLAEVTRQMQTADQRRTAIRVQLVQTSPYGSLVVDGQPILSANDRLRALQTQYVALSSRYGARHPDVISARREMEALQREAGGGGDRQLAQQIENVRAELAVARQKYSPEHPDVASLTRQLERLEDEAARAAPAPRRVAQAPDNPAYVQLQTQLDGVEAEYRALAGQREELRRRLTQYQERIARIPAVERDYMALRRDIDNASAQYNDIKAKKMEAQLSETLEQGRKGERFSLLEPADLPIKPVKPNRIAILVIGFALAAGGGVGTALLGEALNQVVTSPRQMAQITGSQPLAVIPAIANGADASRSRLRLWGVTLSLVLALIVSLALVDQFVKPLDVLWAVAMNRLGPG